MAVVVEKVKHDEYGGERRERSIWWERGEDVPERSHRKCGWRVVVDMLGSGVGKSIFNRSVKIYVA